MWKNEEQKNIKGITLIALVVTIIVLLILAGVSIAMLTGENGIITQAQNAKEKTVKASELEGIQLAVIGSETKDNEYLDILDEESFKKELEKHFGSEKLDVVANGDGSFIITINDRKYYVNDDKTVIDSDNVIEIGPDEFANFRDDVNNGNSYEGKAVLLTSDITLSGEWEPIGFIDSNTDEKNPETENNKPFKGIFDGCNHTINNLKISSTDNKYNGLFSFVVDGTIRNITIGKGSEISGSQGAGVVGYLYGFKGNISNCINYANIKATSGGGIAGVIAGKHTIYNCKNYGEITGRGGILGGSNGVDWEQFTDVSNTIINCGNYGKVTRGNGDHCAGISGYFKGKILNCCNKAEIDGSGMWNAGIVSGIDGTVENCYNISNVDGEECVGGIAGQSGATLGTSVVNCYSLGEITGTKNVGNIIGLKTGIINPEIVNCYTKNDTFTASNLGDAFVDDKENINGGYPMLNWE